MDKKKVGKTHNSEKISQVTSISKGATAPARVTTRLAQNVLLIWLDSNIDDKNNEDCKNTITQLRRIVNNVDTFTDGNQCIEFLSNIVDQKACMIISGSLGQHIVPLVHDMSQVDTIFIFCGNKTKHEQWAKKWPKIKGVYTNIKAICQAVTQAAKYCEHNAMSISFVSTNGNLSKKSSDQLDPTFMYTQILKESLLKIKFEKEHFKEFIDYCKEKFADNDYELENIKDLEKNYQNKTPIWWYTYECFLYPMLNRSLRVMDIDIIIKIGFFIKDLHYHIDQLYKEQLNNHEFPETFTVYRGQGLTKTDFDQMMTNQGGLISFNNFLSTSKQRNVSLKFAHDALSNLDMVGVLFIMTIDSSVSTTPFASITKVSYYEDKEDEVLFSMQTIFRIANIKQMSDNNRLWQVDLTLTRENDQELRALTEYIREETKGATGWEQLAFLLSQMRQSQKAEQIYEIILKHASDAEEKVSIYSNLGLNKYHQGEYDKALRYYSEGFEIAKKYLSPDDSVLALLYNNIGLVYTSLGEYSQALIYQEKALKIRQKCGSRNDLDIGASYGNIGLLYMNMGEYLKALKYFEAAFAIQQKSLPSNHPDLCLCCNNIGVIYLRIGEYPKALTAYEKTLDMQQKSLPPDHPDVAMCYHNIAGVYHCMGDYPKALLYNEKCCEIHQKAHCPNHPDMAKSYCSIGATYVHMGDYSKALSYQEKALEIQQACLPLDHPDIAASYSTIGEIYRCTGENGKALLYYEKAREIFQKTLPSNHLNMALSYFAIGNVYVSTGELSKALSCHIKALEIRRKSLPPDHPDIGASYNSIGLIYTDTKEYSKAIAHYEKALDIQQKSLPQNHPNFVLIYYNIGRTYVYMNENSKALPYLQCAVDIGQCSLPSNHPNLAVYRKYLEDVKESSKKTDC